MTAQHAHGFRLRWKKNKAPTGLARVGAGPRSSTLFDANGLRFATVNALHRRAGWFWVAGWDSGLPYMNTCNEPVATEAEAKASAMAYVRAAIQKATQGTHKEAP